MKQVISDLATGKFNEALQDVLLYAKSTNKDLDVKTELIGKLKEPDYSALETSGWRACYSIWKSRV